jgi:ketosteroid isomerase-like protein
MSRALSDEAAIMALLDSYTAAIHDKDAAALLACYTGDVVAYDLAPPLAMRGADVLDPTKLQQWFDTWSGPIASRPREVALRVDGSIACAWALCHMKGSKTDGERIDLWFRSTLCLERRAKIWRIAHVHNSVPFTMNGTAKALLHLTPP